MKAVRKYSLLAVMLCAFVAACAAGDAHQGDNAQIEVFPPVLDAQVVVDQDSMKWSDYTPIPGENWADTSRVGSARQLRVALLAADFEDQPFVMTLPRGSDLFGNPQVEPIMRAEIPKFYAEFYNSPQSLNRGHTLHEYWMEQSRGRVGVSIVPFGPFRMPAKSFQYGSLLEGDIPSGHDARFGMETKQIDSLWRAEYGDTITRHFDVIMRVFAGYDATATWQEFGEMKFGSREGIPLEWGNPDTTRPRWVRTRYGGWTSWQGGRWIWSNGAIVQGEGVNSIRHELAHAAFDLADNYNNPSREPLRRAPSGPWDLMDRGAFNGPGGPHRRWVVPPTEGGAMPAGLMLGNRLQLGIVDSAEVLQLSRESLARSGGVVMARVTARAARPEPGAFTGIVVRLDGPSPADRTPPTDPESDPLSPGVSDYNFYSVEVVQQIGYDSFTPDNGVLIAKNKDRARPAGGQNGTDIQSWVIDANPADRMVADFRTPDGAPVLRSIADYRQLNDALFHAGVGSGSQFEWVDSHNRLHFYVVDVHRGDSGVLSYSIAVRSMDASAAIGGEVVMVPPASALPVQRNADYFVELLPAGAEAGVESARTASRVLRRTELYRMSATVEGSGWEVGLNNVVAVAPSYPERGVRVFVRALRGASDSAVVTLRATSEVTAEVAGSMSFTVRRGR